ncbi:MAG: hypothetical protein ACYDGN_02070 [Acidimicrobiales bacterium]
MGRSARIAIVGSVLGAAVALAVFTAMAFVASTPPTVDFTLGHQPGKPVNVTLQVVGAYGSGTHPGWVSYLTQTPQGNWVHTTLWELPAHSLIKMTVLQYDSGSPLRNQERGTVLGTTGGYMLLNGKKVRVINSNTGNGVAHTFSVPSLGINVPLYGNGPDANLCSAAPCTTSSPHNVIKFSFRTPGPGQYPWQCFVPCGLGYLYGNGGPMQTIGYMDGFLKVVA